MGPHLASLRNEKIDTLWNMLSKTNRTIERETSGTLSSECNCVLSCGRLGNFTWKCLIVNNFKVGLSILLLLFT